jgi:hypothetical protein
MDKELEKALANLTPAQKTKMLDDLAPIIRNMDSIQGYPPTCPACGKTRWKTKTKQNNSWICRSCGYIREIVDLTLEQIEGE